MKMNGLIRYGIPPEIIGLWRKQESDNLLPLQEMAVKRCDLFGDRNLLIQAPTSAGKTFIGEMAGLEAAMRRKRVIYLAPLKALAGEKYRDFQEKYAPYGLQVIVSTRDHREFDARFEAGDFSIAVVVYEKLSQLLVRRPERLEEVALIIADELEILSDPERGAMVEILLTRILQSKSRLIGLSAVIGDAEKLAEWMRAKLVFYEHRPVELRYGVLNEGGVFRYRTFNERSEGEERLLEAPSDSPWEILRENVRMLAERGESCLIFVKDKHESRRGAERLARQVNLPAAAEAIEALRRIEATHSRDTLLDTLNTGVAFHNADLSSEERCVVEQAFRTGEIQVIVSTSTLAVGMNLPAQNVFIAPDKWRYDRRLGMPWKTPILTTDYVNMSGRAGRYGSGHGFGRSILIATTPFDLETYWRRYIEGECEGIAPRLAHEALEDPVLRLVASRFCRTEGELHAFIERTLTGQWVWSETLTLEETAFRIRAATNRAIDAGMMTQNAEGRLEATPLGLAVAAKGIAMATARDLEHWIGESETRTWADMDLLLAAAMTHDGRMLQVPLTSREYDRADYVGKLKALTDGDDIAADVALNRIRNCSLMPFFEEVRAIKAALFLSEWIDHAALRELEKNYGAMAGQIVAAADQVSWLIDATAAIAAAVGAESGFVERIKMLSERVQRGLQAEALPLARAGSKRLTRRAVTTLAAQGLHTPQALTDAPLEALAAWVDPAEAHRLKKWALRVVDRQPERSEPPPKAKRPVLIIDDKHPGEILVDGARIRLQDKQYRLIQTLAAFPGDCVPYKTIYQTVWGDTVVEPNQMHFQKRRLLSKIQAELPERAQLITTIPKRGFVLNLTAEEVALRPLRVPSAA